MLKWFVYSEFQPLKASVIHLIYEVSKRYKAVISYQDNNEKVFKAIKGGKKQVLLLLLFAEP